MEINVRCLCGNCFRERSSPDCSCGACGYDPAADRGRYPMALRPGSILNGKYIIGRVLGQGGFGITYLALDYTLKMRVAVKEFFPENIVSRRPGAAMVSLGSPELEDVFIDGIRSFLDEARVLAKFQGNLNIVGVREFFEENRTAYFVMDYVEGTSFKSYIVSHGGKVSWQEAAKVLIPVMDALEAVHLSGILHRDVTPDNIYLTKSGTVKLLDFGAARYAAEGREQSLDVFLKEGYAPIEQYDGHGRQGPYTDVYSLAATFYSAITGYLPPPANERENQDTLVPPSARGAAIPPELEAALLKGLAVRPEHRFQSVADFRTAIIRLTVSIPKTPEAEGTGKHQDVRPVIQTPPVANRAGGAGSVPRPENGPVTPDQSGKRRQPWPAAKALAVSLTCAALLVIAGITLIGGTNRTSSGSASGSGSSYTSGSADPYAGGGNTASADTEAVAVQFYTSEPQAGTYIAQSLKKLGMDAEANEADAYSLLTCAETAMAAGESPLVLFGGGLTEEDAEALELTPLYPKNWEEPLYVFGLEGNSLFLKTFEALTAEIHVKDEQYWYVSGGELCGTYTGYVKDGDCDGWGVMTYADGRAYAGYWREGAHNGRGTLSWPNGDRIECDFVDNVFCGSGIYRWADGRRYEGEFADGERNGQGTIYYPDGTSKSGIWKDGQLTG